MNNIGRTTLHYTDGHSANSEDIITVSTIGKVDPALFCPRCLASGGTYPPKAVLDALEHPAMSAKKASSTGTVQRSTRLTPLTLNPAAGAGERGQ